MGYLWVRDYPGIGEGPRRYHVFEEGGGLVGWIDIPGHLKILEIGEGYLLALVRDETGVESVCRYLLTRS